MWEERKIKIFRGFLQFCIHQNFISLPLHFLLKAGKWVLTKNGENPFSSTCEWRGENTILPRVTCSSPPSNSSCVSFSLAFSSVCSRKRWTEIWIWLKKMSVCVCIEVGEEEWKRVKFFVKEEISTVCRIHALNSIGEKKKYIFFFWKKRTWNFSFLFLFNSYIHARVYTCTCPNFSYITLCV